ncbi:MULTISPECIES: hypothetical protein [Pseudomonas aeruginosa group]|uniref:Uncharacterized protein n=1 Tax=Pseudomonas paraeruginosa TaxID=2994495 RepID=A0A2R3IND8_9PSED|nr:MULTISPECIES: hypothetical protein [Pseudomonas aeruginosa group]AVK03430.1 hypothetical protein CSB93_1277 [Pseudomonas paraeruginosa]AWE91587.1 hypothetical protein CSC28_0047 [Pseudomonas paraeruginosa]MBG4071636.1 hypothetical protein [Pseudomonas aeruginosa]MBG5604045.1 hypothetical protein [Pseudomonas aeruginosa]MBG5757352.1 hypothetical protein [Pseudomonas aeruginosa]
MKFASSTAEKEIREALISSAKYIFKNEFILKFLERVFGSLSSAYVLSHTPDQGEDFYVVLVNGSAVVKFELSRGSANAEPENFSVIDISNYKGLIRGRHAQLKLAIAIELTAGKVN